ncbi:IS701 family transposase [Streptomyces sp. ISL-98]|uniref:IS701 family transposase n=1 Tax=Streptomyces sp. ISL-98 TaxID=2819192 RepID=UPI0020364520|nr:IS701 family transposase [Streptomyces sp. ISL-98]
MSRLVSCPPAPGPLEGFAAEFDGLFTHLAQRRKFREYLAGLLAPRERSKTLTCLAGAEPVVGSKDAAVQRLQYFLSESCWEPDAVNGRRLELLLANPALAPHAGGVLVIDDSGDRKDGTATAFTGPQYLGRIGKTDNGIVTVTAVWADERVYYPVHAEPYCPARRLPQGTRDPAFHTKWWIAADLAVRAAEDGFGFRAVTGDCAYGDTDNFRAALREADLPFVLAVRPRRGTWARESDAHTPVEAARRLAWGGPAAPGGWTPVTRCFRDGSTRVWWAADAVLGGWGPDSPTRLVVATADPGTLPQKATWYLVTNLPRPGGPRDPARGAGQEHRAASLPELVRIYGLRHWIEQSYKQVKDELGWADFQVRSALAIRRHQALVHCAFTFCWEQWFTPPGPSDATAPETGPVRRPERGTSHVPPAPTSLLAQGPARGPLLAHPRPHAAALVEHLVHQAPTS